MKGKGIRSDFTVTDSGKDTKITASTRPPSTAHHQYAPTSRTSAQLVDETPSSSTLYKAGEDDEARQLFPTPAALGAHRDRRRVLR